jgi:hypothetical protein
VLRNIINSRYNKSVPFKHPTSKFRDYLFQVIRITDKAYFKLTSLVVKRKPKINSGTKAFLDQYFYSKMQGVDELVQKDRFSHWFPDKAKKE